MYRPLEFHGFTEILLSTLEMKLEVLKSGVSIRGVQHDARDIPGTWTNLIIRGIDHEIKDTELDNVLKTFGTVGSKRRLCFRDTKIFNGERSVSIQIKNKVPNLLKICGRWCQIFYPGVLLQCFRCHMEGHLASTCPLNRCHNCGLNGHSRSLCREACFKCNDRHVTPWCTLNISREIAPTSSENEKKQIDNVTEKSDTNMDMDQTLNALEHQLPNAVETLNALGDKPTTTVELPPTSLLSRETTLIEDFNNKTSDSDDFCGEINTSALENSLTKNNSKKRRACYKKLTIKKSARLKRLFKTD